ncbi:uncharacterized protein LOC126372661 [Pectinophora gossypiella]|uniref:uncharacterized protein LOC126372661 n=1 Tax=Pectinophora gossypiella TaxID=13191 RepID=UPI00214F5B20|nr:uncharacterized protein LOC126372661 [Pectinophora gossypiella]
MLKGPKSLLTSLTDTDLTNFYVRASVSHKNKVAARLWQQRWGFYSRLREVQEEEALRLGFSLEEYRAAIRSVSCQPEPKIFPVDVAPSPKPLPPTSTGMIGRRAQCPLERYGRLVKTPRDYPTRPPLPPGQVYDPYKQTIVFLGSVIGDPISYKLPPARSEIPDEVWAEPRQLSVTQLNPEVLERVMRGY